MLNVMILAYRDKTVNDLSRLDSVEKLQQQIFASYIRRMLERLVAHKQFTQEQTRRYLTWLAQQMQQQQLTEFYLERLQPDWLPTTLARKGFRWVVGLVVGLLGGLVGGLLYGLSGISINASLRRKPNQGIRHSGGNALRLGIPIAIGTGLVFGLVYGLIGGLVVGLLYGLVVGLLGGLFVGLAFGGEAYLRHYLFRFLLWWGGALPWHVVALLEEATDCILLHRIRS